MSDDSEFSSSGSESGDSFADKDKPAEAKESKDDDGSESQSTDDDDSESDSSESEPEFQASNDGTGDKMESKITTVSNAHHDEAMELSMSQSTVNTDAAAGDGPAGEGAGTDHKALENQPYDEAVELSSSSDDHAQTPAAKGGAAAAAKKPADSSDSGSESSSTDSDDSSPKAQAVSQAAKPEALQSKDDSSDSDSDSDSDNSDSSGKPAGNKRKSYANLRVSHEIQELFQYIKHYEPPQMELDTKLKCFIPDYIPSIGNIDPFIKVARPDGKPDELGLTVLDEPHSQQSDSTVLEMQLRAVSKKSNLKEMAVACIENAEKDTGRIERWIESIDELHRSKPPPSVSYTDPMPDVESLMQVWPPEFEEVLRTFEVPPAELDVSLDEYAQICCNLLDIPMHKSAVQSLHVFFTLYTEFAANQHFIVGAADSAKAAMEGNAGGSDVMMMDTGSSQMMVLSDEGGGGGGGGGSESWRADDTDGKHDDGKEGKEHSEGKDSD